MAQALTLGDVERIAALARLALTESEKTLLVRQLTEVLEYAAEIQGVDTSGVPATSQVLSEPVDREDRAQPPLSNAEALANAPDPARQSGLFRVPRVLG